MNFTLPSWSMVLLTLSLASCQPASPPPNPSAEFTKADGEAIMAVLDRQVAAWNQGDLEGYLSGYTQEGGVRFASERGVFRGWNKALERYRSDYSNPQLMGELSFHDLTLTPLSGHYAELFGHYTLKRPNDGPTDTGSYTFLFKRTSHGWRILHDHSSRGTSY